MSFHEQRQVDPLAVPALVRVDRDGVRAFLQRGPQLVGHDMQVITFGSGDAEDLLTVDMDFRAVVVT